MLPCWRQCSASGGHQPVDTGRRAAPRTYARAAGPPRLQYCQMADTPLPGRPAKASASSGQTLKSGQGNREGSGMPRRRGIARSGKRVSGRPGVVRLSARARVVGGALAALAVLAALAAAVLAGSGGPAGVRAASGPGAGSTATGAGGGAPPGLQTYSGAANPNPAAHPDTIPGPAAPPVDPALTLGRANAPVIIEEFGDYQCTNCGAFA